MRGPGIQWYSYKERSELSPKGSPVYAFSFAAAGRVSQGKSELGEGAISIKTISAVSRRVRRGPQRKPANG